MGINFTALLGGAAKGISNKLYEDDRKAEKKADRAYTASEETRLYNRDKRDKENLVNKELAGLLTSLNYNPRSVTKIMSAGNLSAKYWADLGKTAVQKGVDPNSLLNISSTVDIPDSSAEKKAEEIINPTPSMAKVPDAIGGVTASAEAKTGSVTLAEGFTVNAEAISKLFAPQDEFETTYGAALAVLSQKIAQNPNNPEMSEWRAEQAELLDAVGKHEKAKREKGEKGDAFGIGTISSNVNEIRAGAVRPLGMTIGLKGEIEGINDGNRHLAYVADISVAEQMIKRNTKIQSETMNYAADGIRNAAIENLTDYAMNLYSSDKSAIKIVETNEEFAKNMESGVYKRGDIVNVGNKIMVYTGIVDYKTNEKFIYLGGS